MVDLFIISSSSGDDDFWRTMREKIILAAFPWPAYQLVQLNFAFLLIPF